jgi:hypothetical protein
MHLLGRHFSVTVESAARAPRVLVDEDYTFDAQVIYPIAPTTIDSGDTLSVACNYFNPTGTEVQFGERTQDEMCFSGVYWYPARDSAYLCLI